MKIIFEQPSGVIAVIHPIEEYMLTHTMEELALHSVPEGLPYWIVDDETIPFDRAFRNAWKYKPDVKEGVDIDIPLAQEITKTRLRAERKPLLEALDVEMMRNLQNPIELARIEAEKQLLRDVTLEVNNLESVEALKEFTVVDYIRTVEPILETIDVKIIS